MSKRWSIVGIVKIILLAVWICASVSGKSQARPTISKYSANEDADSRVLNVHIVPHSHDDVGWLKTVDQYYYGWNETIQEAHVQNILDSVIEALLEDQARTFVYVETKFFSMWWKDQSNTTKASVKRLIHDTRQLSFANGGWCMHDEATTHFMGMIDQTSLGHEFLKKELGVIPTIGWQLDPFGHSSAQASLMTYKVGFDALYFGRIDYQDRQKRKASCDCEGLWNGNSNHKSSDHQFQDDIESDKTVFWGLTGSYNGQYGPPQGICFDPNCDETYTPLIEMNTTARRNLVKKFLLNLKQQSDQTRDNHILVTMGEDFRYQKALVNFDNLDLLFATTARIQHDVDISSIFPEYDSINVFYSSPEYYTQCKYKETIRARQEQENTTRKDTPVSFSRALLENQKTAIKDIQWSVKHDDFLPYSDCPHCFWTGYFSSRPALKRFERVGSSFLMAVRQLESYNGSSFCGQQALHELEDAMGILQHHDGVSGTSKQHVAYDYAKRLQAGIDTVLPCTIRKLKKALLVQVDDLKLDYCQLLNETRCDVSVKATKINNVDLYVIVYNSLASQRSSFIDLPVGSSGTFLVEAWQDGSSTTETILEAQPSFFSAPHGQRDKTWMLSFSATALPPLGAKVFRIRKQYDKRSAKRKIKEERLQKVSNGKFSLWVDTHTGEIFRTGFKGVERLNSWGYYTSFDSNRGTSKGEKPQNSGAYVFRPSTPMQELVIIPTKKASVIQTSLGTEIRTEYQASWIRTITKLRTGVPYLEIEYEVGPIPIVDGIGKEVVARYNTTVDNHGIFYTDSNGREFLRRKRNYRPTWNFTVYEPIAGNYYPINTAMYVDEAITQANSSSRREPAAFAVVTDRSQGGGSIVDGTVELMVHRRTLADDDRGVKEPINETDSGIEACPPFGNATRMGDGLIIRGKHRILIENNKRKNKKERDRSSLCPNNEVTCGGIGGARLARSLMDESFAEPLVFVGTASSSDEVPFRKKQFSGVTEALPKNVMLITKKPLYDSPNTYLVRLGHQYGRGEDPDHSRPVDVDLSHLFPGQQLLEFSETTLSGNRAIEDWRMERFDWIGSSVGSHSNNDKEDSKERSTIITLTAMDIRTFIVRLGE